uniref:Uncharacterized protein n=1 Tax=Ananas comosus var. bracteatus TaxID=296719 RepID=A0A6V7P2G3_ANACO|nr:unnamed protein product [Ananas comosus var. bracteatus]
MCKMKQRIDYCIWEKRASWIREISSSTSRTGQGVGDCFGSKRAHVTPEPLGIGLGPVSQACHAFEGKGRQMGHLVPESDGLGFGKGLGIGLSPRATQVTEGWGRLGLHGAGDFGRGPVPRPSHFFEGRGKQRTHLVPEADGLGIGDGLGSRIFSRTMPGAEGWGRLGPHGARAFFLFWWGPTGFSVAGPGGTLRFSLVEAPLLSGLLDTAIRPAPIASPYSWARGWELDPKVVAVRIGSASWERAPEPIPIHSTESFNPHLPAADVIHGSRVGKVHLTPDNRVVCSPAGTVSGITSLAPNTAPLTDEMTSEVGSPLCVRRGPTRACVRLKSVGNVSALDRAKLRKAFLLEGENSEPKPAEGSRIVRKVVKKSAQCGVKLTGVEAEELHKFMMRG